MLAPQFCVGAADNKNGVRVDRMKCEDIPVDSLACRWHIGQWWLERRMLAPQVPIRTEDKNGIYVDRLKRADISVDLLARRRQTPSRRKRPMLAPKISVRPENKGRLTVEGLNSLRTRIYSIYGWIELVPLKLNAVQVAFG